jgi:hypothetical protein
MPADVASVRGGEATLERLQSPFARTPFLEDESKAERRRRRDAERLAETRPLDPWERYRALSDHVAHLLDVTELADRKTRFALLIMGALNAVNVMVAVRAPQIGADGLNHVFVQFYVTGYVLLSLYFFIFAIIALRPRMQEMTPSTSSENEETSLQLLCGTPAGDADAYYDTWRQAELSQVNREMAVRSHLLARANAEKFRALRRVYHGLLVLVGLTAILAAIIGLHVLAGSQ